MKLSSSQREEFAQRGVIRIEKLISDDVLAPARASVLEVLEREGVWQDGAWQDGLTDVPEHNRLARLLKRPVKGPAFKDLETADLLDVVRDLVDGRAVSTTHSQGQLLFTPPNATVWTVPHTVWHLDVPRLGDLGLPGVQTFLCLDRVPPGGGGTLVVAGSHRLVNDQGRIRSKDVKKRLRSEPYFAELFRAREGDPRRLLEEPGRAGDVELRVVEFHGEPGDVYLTDLRMLHTLAPNASRRPRLVVTQRFFLESALSQIVGLEPAAQSASRGT